MDAEREGVGGGVMVVLSEGDSDGVSSPLIDRLIDCDEDRERESSSDFDSLPLRLSDREALRDLTSDTE